MYVNHFFIIDKLFSYAKLVKGFDKDMQVVGIKKQTHKTFWQRMFG